MRSNILRRVVNGWIAVLIAFSGCKKTADPVVLKAYQAMNKIDSHTHVNQLDGGLIAQAMEDNFRIVTINVKFPPFPSLEAQLQMSRELKKQHPDRVAYVASFDATEAVHSDWWTPEREKIFDAKLSGAVGIKIWRDIGMEIKDAQGRYLMLDDSRLDPLFTYLTAKQIAVFVHTGEPKNCWLPFDQMTVANDRRFYEGNPDYHMFNHPEVPGYEQQLAHRDAVLDRHPDLHYVGLHLGGLEWSVKELSQFLDRYPNAVVDTAGRLGHLQVQSDQQAVRDFFINYQNRILYGSDLRELNSISIVGTSRYVRNIWFNDWEYLAGDTLFQSAYGTGKVKGLGLPEAVLKKIYYENASKLLKIWPEPS